MKRNKLLSVLFIVLLCIIFAACGKSQPAPEAMPVPTAAPTPQPTPEPTPYISPDADKIKAETMSISTQLPDAARPNMYSGYAADITFAPTAPRSASIA